MNRGDRGCRVVVDVDEEGRTGRKDAGLADEGVDDRRRAEEDQLTLPQVDSSQRHRFFEPAFDSDVLLIGVHRHSRSLVHLISSPLVSFVRSHRHHVDGR